MFSFLHEAFYYSFLENSFYLELFLENFPRKFYVAWSPFMATEILAILKTKTYHRYRTLGEQGSENPMHHGLHI
jgi:hypothetical protein